MEFEQLVKLIQAVSDSDLTGFKYEENGVKLSLNKEKVQVAVQGAVATMATTEIAAPSQVAGAAVVEAPNTAAVVEEKSGKLVKSPLVGTFYTAPTEDAEPFVTVGASVKKGQTVAIIEAMKLMNDIECDFDGTITEILVENGEAVEYGQPLFRVS